MSWRARCAGSSGRRGGAGRSGGAFGTTGGAGGTTGATGTGTCGGTWIAPYEGRSRKGAADGEESPSSSMITSSSTSMSIDDRDSTDGAATGSAERWATSARTPVVVGRALDERVDERPEDVELVRLLGDARRFLLDLDRLRGLSELLERARQERQRVEILRVVFEGDLELGERRHRVALLPALEVRSRRRCGRTAARAAAGAGARRP